MVIRLHDWWLWFHIPESAVSGDAKLACVCKFHKQQCLFSETFWFWLWQNEWHAIQPAAICLETGLLLEANTVTNRCQEHETGNAQSLWPVQGQDRPKWPFIIAFVRSIISDPCIATTYCHVRQRILMCTLCHSVLVILLLIQIWNLLFYFCTFPVTSPFSSLPTCAFLSSTFPFTTFLFSSSPFSTFLSLPFHNQSLLSYM